MKQEKIAREFASLSPELQRQVLDFIAFLKTRSGAPEHPKTSKRVPLREEAFVDMWQGRKEMRDSTKWVRDLTRDPLPRVRKSL